VKRSALLRHLRRNGCYLKREGTSHSLWCNPATGTVEAVPRHSEGPINSRKKYVVDCLWPRLAVESKLHGLLELKYHGVSDAAAELGSVAGIRELFTGFQRHLYEP